MRIVRVANFVGPRTGGIRTALQHWGQTYRELGHEPVLVHPGPHLAHRQGAHGDVITVAGRPCPGARGYHVMWDRRTVQGLLDGLRPDRVEISDRSTLRWVGPWARRRGIGSVMISHENLTGLLGEWGLTRSRHRVADWVNRRTVNDFDRVVCPSSFAAEEFSRIGGSPLVVPLGVDFADFTPRMQVSPHQTIELVHCGRLSAEKNPGLSIRTVRELRDRGHDVRLRVLGHGPMEQRLRECAAGLPVTFLDYLSDRRQVADVLRSADVAIAPGPVETFGLAALEALACGTPVVCPDQGALQEVVGSGGCVKPSHATDFADGVLALVTDPAARQKARSQAERFSWNASGTAMIAIHSAL